MIKDSSDRASTIHSNKAFIYRLLSVTLFNFVLRLTWLAFTAHITTTGLTDQSSYVLLGESLADSRSYTAFNVAPGYPIFLGFITEIQRLTILRWFPLRMTAGFIQAIMGSSIILVVGLLTRRLADTYLSKRRAEQAGLIAAAILAIWPNQIIGTSVLISERLATPLFIWFVATLLWNKQVTVFRAISAGLLLTALVMTRPTYAPVGVVAVLLIFLRQTPRFRLRCSLALILAFTFSMSSWWCYTAWQAGGVLATGTTSGTFNLCMGNNDKSIGYWSDEVLAEYCPWIDDGSNAAAVSDEMRRRTIDWMLSNLDQQPRLIKLRANYIFENDTDSTSWLPDFSSYSGPGSIEMWTSVSMAWWHSIVWLFIPSLFALIYRLRRSSVWIITFGLVTLIGPLITVGDSRYHEAITIIACVGIAYIPGILSDWSWIPSRWLAKTIRL